MCLDVFGLLFSHAIVGLQRLQQCECTFPESARFVLLQSTTRAIQMALSSSLPVNEPDPTSYSLTYPHTTIITNHIMAFLLVILSTLSLALALPTPSNYTMHIAQLTNNRGATTIIPHAPYPIARAQNKSSKEYRVFLGLLIFFAVAAALLVVWVALTPWLAKRSALKALPHLTEERIDELRKRQDAAVAMEARRQREEAQASESSNAVRTA